jgi:hypothetical protein
MARMVLHAAATLDCRTNFSCSEPATGEKALKLSDVAPGGGGETLRPVGNRVDKGRATGDDIRDQMAGTGADAEAVPAKAGGEYEARNAGNFTHRGYTIGSAVDIARPFRRDPGFCESRQQMPGPAEYFGNSALINSRIENAHLLHGCGFVEPPAHARFMSRAPAFKPAGRKVPPAAGEHRHEISGKPHLLCRNIDPGAAADRQGVTAIRTPCRGNLRRMEGIRQALDTRFDRQD